MRSLKDIENSIAKAKIHTNEKANREVLDDLLERLADAERAWVKAQERAAPGGPTIWRRQCWRRAGYLAAACLVLTSWSVCFVSQRQIKDLEDELESARRAVVSPPIEDPVTINVYLTEHQEVVARQASLSTAAPRPLQMRFGHEDLLYYEIYDEPESIQPGVIFRGRPSQRPSAASESPAITNGQTLTPFEARQIADFDLVCPAWLRPCYRLDEIRRIEDRDALQLLYTDGINSISLFEQPLNGRRGLGPEDFREYVVYRNDTRAGGAILTWRDDALLYVLVGNAEISQLMDMAQSVNAAKMKGMTNDS